MNDASFNQVFFCTQLTQQNYQEGRDVVILAGKHRGATAVLRYVHSTTTQYIWNVDQHHFDADPDPNHNKLPTDPDRRTFFLGLS